jgi:chitinase
VLVAGCSSGGSALGSGGSKSVSDIASQVNTYDFGPTLDNKYNGQYTITVNAGSTAISTISFVTNATFSQISSGYGSLLNSQPKIATSTLANGDTQYTLSYSSPVTVSGQGILTIPYSPDGTNTSSSGTGATLNTAVPLIKNLSVNGTAYSIVNMPAAATNPNATKTITGYLEEWSIYRPYESTDSAFTADTIPYTQLNTVNYGFVNFATPTKSLNGIDSYPAFGSGNYEVVSADDTADYLQLTELYKNKLRYPYLHVFLSFGGWTNDSQQVYPDINYENMTDAQQQTFAQNAVNTMVSLGFDGVDIDWEWWANHNTTSPAVCGTQGTPATVTTTYCSGKVVAHSSQKYLLQVVNMARPIIYRRQFLPVQLE